MKHLNKGVDLAYQDCFYVRAVDQGEVVGRRTYVSRSLSFTPKKRARWKRKRRPKRG